MGKKSISINEALIFLVRRLDRKSKIHKARHYLEAKTLLDLSILLPPRIPDLSFTNICKKD
jgi:hypothetical protein